jgi:hypothetical protein
MWQKEPKGLCALNSNRLVEVSLVAKRDSSASRSSVKSAPQVQTQAPLQKNVTRSPLFSLVITTLHEGVSFEKFCFKQSCIAWP